MGKWLYARFTFNNYTSIKPSDGKTGLMVFRVDGVNVEVDPRLVKDDVNHIDAVAVVRVESNKITALQPFEYKGKPFTVVRVCLTPYIDDPLKHDIVVVGEDAVLTVDVKKKRAR